MSKYKRELYFYFGTTAEFIKLIPVLRGLNKHNIEYKIVLSGQTNVRMKEFENLVGKQKVYKNFESKSTKSSSIGFALWIVKTLFKSLLWAWKEFSDKRAIIIVHGDTTSTLIGSIISKLSRAKLVHVEAGLRTHNLLEPFPEEINRTLVGYLSDVNFCPNKTAFKNIGNKNAKNISTNFNTSTESMSIALKTKINKKNFKINSKQKYFILIVHRQEHLYIKKQETKELIEEIIKNINPKIKCVFIIHDITENFLKEVGLWNKLKKNKNVVLQPRLPYVEFLNLFAKSEFIISDGGGNQTEAHFLGKPCLILRKHTEQTEGLGENVILGNHDYKTIKQFMRNYKEYKYPKKKVKKWQSEIIVENLLELMQK